MSLPHALEGLKSHLTQAMTTGGLQLAPFPMVSARIDKCLREDVQPEVLVAVVGSDSRFAARLVEIAHLLHGVPPGPLPAAVAALPGYCTFGFSLCYALGVEVSAPGALQRLRYNVWRKAVIRAEVLGLLASRYELVPQEAYTCGLLWSYGRIPVIAEIEKLLGRSPLGPHTMSQWLTVVGDFDNFVKEQLAASWRLPAIVRETLRTAASKPDAIPDAHVHTMRQMVELAEKITFVIDSGAVLTSAELQKLGIAERDGQWLSVELPELAKRVWLSNPVPVQPGSSLVLSMPNTLAQPVVTVALRAVEFTPDGQREHACVAFARNGFVLRCEQALRLDEVLHIVLQTPDVPITVYAKVVHTEPHVDGGFSVELKPLALLPKHKKRWESILEASKWQQQSVPMSSDSEGSGVHLLPDFERVAARKAGAESQVAMVRTAVTSTMNEQPADPFAAFVSSPFRQASPYVTKPTRSTAATAAMVAMVALAAALLVGITLKLLG